MHKDDKRILPELIIQIATFDTNKGHPSPGAVCCTREFIPKVCAIADPQVICFTSAHDPTKNARTDMDTMSMDMSGTSTTMDMSATATASTAAATTSAMSMDMGDGSASCKISVSIFPS